MLSQYIQYLSTSLRTLYLKQNDNLNENIAVEESYSGDLRISFFVEGLQDIIWPTPENNLEEGVKSPAKVAKMFRCLFAKVLDAEGAEDA